MSIVHDPLLLSWFAYGANCPVYKTKAIFQSSSTLMDGISILLKMDWIQDVIVPISDSVGMPIIQVIDHSVCNHTDFRHWSPEQGNHVCLSTRVGHPLQKHTQTLHLIGHGPLRTAESLR